VIAGYCSATRMVKVVLDGWAAADVVGASVTPNRTVLAKRAAVTG